MRARKPSEAQLRVLRNLIAGHGVAAHEGRKPNPQIERTVAVCEREGWIGDNRDGQSVITDAGREAAQPEEPAPRDRRRTSPRATPERRVDDR